MINDMSGKLQVPFGGIGLCLLLILHPTRDAVQQTGLFRQLSSRFRRELSQGTQWTGEHTPWLSVLRIGWSAVGIETIGDTSLNPTAGHCLCHASQVSFQAHRDLWE
jgi:hypothetical protein